MMNNALIEQVVTIVQEYWAAEGIYETDEAIRNRVIHWYNNTDIVDPYMLAAAAMSGDYRFGTTYDEIADMERFYFPEDEYNNSAYEEYLTAHENFHIGEIEESYEF